MTFIMDKDGKISVIADPLEGKENDLANLLAFVQPTAGDVITFDGTQWVAGQIPPAALKVTIGSNNKLDKTWQEIKDALDAGRVVNIADVSTDATVITQIVAAKKESTDYNVYIAGGEDPAFTATAADGYPEEAAPEVS